MSDAWLDFEQFIREMRTPAALPLDEKLTRDMDLYHDLDWEPAKIVETMRVWSERFRVDLRDFNVACYVPSAAMRKRDVAATALKSLFSARARASLGGRALTLGMLDEAGMMTTGLGLSRDSTR
ncbi:DUF1493 family protein [Paraburkholderia sp. Ac-20336]|uniref:DUF1493 family protein n=1 Tax=Paraburkholderia sp. Ac-20336 TaxID=2703886 RepID=UPI00198026FE|nr:DUF1493 family protein [Paraburkholderia sp. Ac-20336]MBN3803279.1 DUF1493 family protein [Paraburkholderia sp. Ac-20336]